MTVNEISDRLRARLQEEYGVDEAAILMDRPPGGWGDLVTNQSLDRRLAPEFALLRSEMNAGFAQLQSSIDRQVNAQTWRLMTATLSAMAILVAAMVAAVKL
jgi:hypothetical protein